MYESFFDFHDRPFAASPLVENYYPAESLEHARQTLIRVIERAEGPGIVVGQAGLGKSLLCRLVAEYFRDTFDVVVLSSTRVGNRKSLLQNILYELGLPYRELEEGELRLALLDFLQPGNSSPNGMLLIVDEAHTLPLRLLEEVRMITNLVREGRPRARLVMAGGPRLEERFAHPKLDSFNQRLAARCYLENLQREDTFRYVRSQIAAVGGEPQAIFTDDAMDAVQRASDGIPRLINQICDHALILGAAGGRRQIDARVVEEAWADLQQLPGPWREVSDSSDNSPIVEFGELDDQASLEIDFESGDDHFSTAADPSEEIDLDRADVSADASTGMMMGDDTDDDFLSSGQGNYDIDQAAPSELADSANFDFPQVIIGQQFDGLSDHDAANMDAEPPITEEELPVVETPNQSLPQTSREDRPDAEALDPFDGEFEEEEVVIDRYTAQAIEAFRDRPVVSSSEGREIAGLLDDDGTSREEPEISDDLEAAAGHLQGPDHGEALNDPQSQDGEPVFEYSTHDTWVEERHGDVESRIEESLKELGERSIESDQERELTCVVFPEPASDGDDREIMIITDEAGVEVGMTEHSVEPADASGAARQVEYQELFAQLRKQ